MNRTVALIFATDTSLFGEVGMQKAATQLHRAESILKAKGIDDEEKLNKRKGGGIKP